MMTRAHLDELSRYLSRIDPCNLKNMSLFCYRFLKSSGAYRDRAKPYPTQGCPPDGH